MYGILFRVKAKPGEYQALIDFLKWDGEVSIDEENGTCRFEFYQDPGDKEALYVYEAYRDRESFEKHQKNKPFQQWDKDIKKNKVAEFREIFRCDALFPPVVETDNTLTDKYRPVPMALRPSLEGTTYILPDFGITDSESLKGYRVALVTTHAPELSEFHVPVTYLRDRGATVDVVTQDWVFDSREAPGMVVLAQWLAVNVCARADKKVSDAKIEDYDAVVTIGGAWNPIMLRTDDKILEFIRGAKDRNLLIASICHGPQLLISAGVFPPGTQATGVSDIRLDMTNAGFRVVECPVVYDKEQRLITSPNPDALKEFCEEIGRRLPEVKEKKTTNTPVAKPEVEQFIRDWFGKLDIHPPVEEMLPFLADEKLVMKMPEKTYCRYEGFKAWYEDIGIQYDEQVHIIRGLQIILAQDTAKVEIVVQWQRSEKNATAAERGRKGFYAAQTWEVERSPQTQRLVIVTYNVASFVPMVTKDNVSEYEKKWLDELNRGDVSVADKVFASGCNIHIIESQKSLNKNDFKNQVKKDLSECPGMQFTIEDQIIAGDKNVFRWVANGLCKGKPTQVEGLILDQVENGKVVERWEKKRPHFLTTDKCCTIVPYFAVLSGKLDEFKGLCKELVTKASKERKCLYYGFSFDEHNEHHAHCREGYADAEGLLDHIDNVRGLVEKVEEIAVIYRLEIHGHRDELEKLKTLREKLKRLNPVFFTAENGFRKQIGGGNMSDENNQTKKAIVYPDPKGREMYKRYFGKEDKRELVGLREFTINHLFAHIYSRSDEKLQISLKDRCMITVSLLAAQGREEQLKEHMRAACYQGISKEQMLEIMIHVAHYAGWAAGNFGQRIALEVYEEKTAEQELKELNIQFGEKEKNRDEPFFKDVLSDAFIFRRANGDIVDKTKFLNDLKNPNNSFDEYQSDDIVATVNGNMSVVTLRVRAKGTRDGKPFDGFFRNTRIFLKWPDKQRPWQLYFWFNMRIEDEKP